jgi:hypothetical protein
VQRRWSCIQEPSTGAVAPNDSKNSQISPSSTVPTAQGAGSRSNRTSLPCRVAGKNANIHADSGVIWGIPAKNPIALVASDSPY